MLTAQTDYFATRKGGAARLLTLIKQYLSNHIIFHTTFRAFIQAIVKIKSSALTYIVKSTLQVSHHQYTLALPRVSPMHPDSVV